MCIYRIAHGIVINNNTYTHTPINIVGTYNIVEYITAQRSFNIIY